MILRLVRSRLRRQSSRLRSSLRRNTDLLLELEEFFEEEVVGLFELVLIVRYLDEIVNTKLHSLASLILVDRCCNIEYEVLVLSFLHQVLVQSYLVL